MLPFRPSLLLANLIDNFHLQLPDSIINWLTPIWILGIGAISGLVLCLAIWLVAAVLSRISLLGSLAENAKPRRVTVAILTIVLLAAWFLLGGNPWSAPAAAAVPAANPAAAAPQQPAPNQFNRILDGVWATAGMAFVCFLGALAAVYLVSRRTIDETGIALREGVLWPLLITALSMAAFGVFGLTIVRKPSELLSSLTRWPTIVSGGTVTQNFDIAAPPNNFDEPPQLEIAVDFRSDEIRKMLFQANRPLRISTHPFADQTPTSIMFDVPAGEEQRWQKTEGGSNPFGEQQVRKLYVKNLSSEPAQLQFTAVSNVVDPEMLIVPLVAFSIAGVFFFYLLQRSALPKLAAISLATSKSEIAQPLYAIILGLGVFLLVVFVYIPYNTFGEDIKMLKDSGLSLIRVLAIAQAVWAASAAVSEEIEGRTALTVLSKPVSRRDFIIGKFVGISWSSALLIIVLGLVLLVTVAYKPIYDAREGADYDPTWQRCFHEMVQIIPGLVLAFMETLVMAALSVAISTRLPALANFIVCSAIYVLGHLTPLMVQSQVVAEQLPPVVFFGRLIATALPVLDHFNIQASVAAGVDVPLVYLGWSLVYCALYSTMAMLLALTLFEDRDLA
jgi:ABC-type transport system involved in multi-copper enzyme maturation permease subunit